MVQRANIGGIGDLLSESTKLHMHHARNRMALRHADRAADSPQAAAGVPKGLKVNVSKKGAAKTSVNSAGSADVPVVADRLSIKETVASAHRKKPEPAPSGKGPSFELVMKSENLADGVRESPQFRGSVSASESSRAFLRPTSSGREAGGAQSEPLGGGDGLDGGGGGAEQSFALTFAAEDEAEKRGPPQPGSPEDRFGSL